VQVVLLRRCVVSTKFVQPRSVIWNEGANEKIRDMPESLVEIRFLPGTGGQVSVRQPAPGPRLQVQRQLGHCTSFLLS